VDARRKERLLLSPGFGTTSERAECEEAVGGTLGFGAFAVGKELTS
jgi:hypothetical protein